MPQSNEYFDPSLYVRIPRMDVSAAVAVSRQILTALPKTKPSVLKKSIQKFEKALSSLEELWQIRSLEQRSVDMRVIDRSADLAWGRLFRRLEEYATLPSDDFPLSTRAQELIEQLFPERLSFLRLDYASQWAEAERRLNTIRDEKLNSELDRLCGPEFLKDVERCHVVYGEMIGATKPKQEIKAEPNLMPALDDTLDALTKLCVQLTALYMSEEEETHDWILKALQPLDEYRAQTSRRRNKSKAAKMETEPSKNT